MIARIRTSRPRLTPEHYDQFLRMLPVITRMSSIAFCDRDPESREEATAEVIAVAYMMFVGLVQNGRETLAYPTPLAAFGIKQVKIGRKAATKLNCKDVSSEYARLKKGIVMERLSRFNKEDNSWQEIVVEDKHATPADVACVRIDFAAWLRTLSRRDRRISQSLAAGATAADAAQKFGVSSGRISQLRRELKNSWQKFQAQSLGGLAVA